MSEETKKETAEHTPEQEAKPEPNKGKTTGKEMAVVRIRGDKGVNSEILRTLKMLGLERPNYCVILPAVPSMTGMVRRARNYVTWGDVDAETKGMLIEKRGKRAASSGKNKRQIFRLNPPKKGFGRKGIKKDFTIGGTLGDRREKINDLIKRMI